MPALAAPPTPDAGQLLQQIESERRVVQPPRPVPEVAPAPRPMRALGGATLTVKNFRFAGNKLLGHEALAAAVAGFVDRPVDFADLQRAAAAVAGAYRQAGWIVRVYLPEQDIVAGEVTIQVVEAVFGGTRLEPAEPYRVASGIVRRTVEHAQAKGEPLNAQRLDRALLLLGDLPGLSVAGSLSQGAEERETDLVLKLSDGPLLTGDVGLDNFGARSTGAARLGAEAFLNSPLRRGDQAAASLIHAQGLSFARLAYSLPVGVDGLRISVDGSSMSYRLVSSDFSSLGAKGTSSASGLDLSYPLLRTGTRNLALRTGVDHKRFDNEANGATTSSYIVNSFSAGLSGNLLDELGGGGASTAALILTQGTLGAGHPDLGSTSASGEDRYRKLYYSLARRQSLGGPVTVYASLAGQVAHANLDSSEKLYLGGPDAVRAYPVNEGGGSQGQVLNLELRWQLPSKVTLAGFYDWGHVQVNHTQTAGTTPNAYDLSGVGLSLNWQAEFGLTLRAVLAHRLGGNPAAGATGLDQDGSHVLNRFWLSAVQPF